MKNVVKLIGAAALASCIPFVFQRNREEESLSVHALLWTANIHPDPEQAGKKKVDVLVALHNPFAPLASALRDKQTPASAGTENQQAPTV